MKAGPELDTLVTEQVMGYVPCDHWIIDTARSEVVGIEAHTGHGDQKCYPRGYPEKWSTDWGAAGQVVERMAGLNYLVTIHRYPSRCVCSIRDDSIGKWHAEAKIVPHAICLAALAAVKSR